MTRSTVFTISRSQAVRLPKSVALPDDVRHVVITRVGQSLLISPADRTWDSFFDGPSASEDYLSVREQPEPQRRERP